MMPKITIGLVTYNRAHLLKRAIDSMLNQTFKDFELIISDDNSTDNTAEIVVPYITTDSRLRYVKRKGVGMTANFMYTLNESRSFYFMWLCDDDFVSENYLECCVEFLEKNSTYSTACGVTKFMIDGKATDDNESLFLEHNNSDERVWNYYKQVGSNIILYGLMRTHQVKDLMYPDTFGADLLWSSQVVFLGKVKIIDSCFLFYSTNGISQQTQNLKAYYKATRGKKSNPYKTFRNEAFSLLINNKSIFSSLSFFRKFKLAISVWLLIRERFCMPIYEAKIRGTLKVRSRLKELFKEKRG